MVIKDIFTIVLALREIDLTAWDESEQNFSDWGYMYINVALNIFILVPIINLSKNFCVIISIYYILEFINLFRIQKITCYEKILETFKY